jgi:hypothetical protein
LEFMSHPYHLKRSARRLSSEVNRARTRPKHFGPSLG